MKSNPISFILTHMSTAILWNIFAIVETMFKIRSHYYIIELFGKIYVTNCYCLLEKRSNFFCLETCNTTTNACNQELHFLVFLCKLNKLINVWFDSFHTSLHGWYGISLTCQPYTNSPLSSKFIMCSFCCTPKMFPCKITTKDENFILFKHIYSTRSYIGVFRSILAHNLTIFTFMIYSRMSVSPNL